MSAPAPAPAPSGLAIRTSSRDWLVALSQAYRSKLSVLLVDDANLGLDPLSQTLFDMGKKANLSVHEWVAVMIGLGVGAVGAYLVVMAVLDPEPYSKIAFALGAGSIMTLGGGFSAMRVITGHKPPSVRVSPTGGFEIRFD